MDCCSVLEEHLQGRIRSPRAVNRTMSIWNGMLEYFARLALKIKWFEYSTAVRVLRSWILEIAMLDSNSDSY